MEKSATARAPASPTLLYIADPMCSWCWGFAPVIGALHERFGERCRIRLIAGGLYPGTTEAMTDGFKATVREHWQHVQEASGQPFNFDFFQRDGFVYNTEPPCRALVVARLQRPGSEFDLLERLHAAFYRDGRDITDETVLIAVAGEAGLDAGDFAQQLRSDEARQETLADFALARELGMRGLPTLLAYDVEQVTVMTEGYRRLPAVAARVEQALAADTAG